MATEEEIDVFKALCESCLIPETNELVVNPNWGGINFLDAVEDIERGRAIIKHWLLVDVRIIPAASFPTIQTQIAHFKAHLDAITNFKMTGDVTKNRNSILTIIQNHYIQLYSNSNQFLPYLLIKESGFTTSLEGLQEKILSMQEEAQTIKFSQQTVENESQAHLKNLTNKVASADKTIKNAKAQTIKLIDKANDNAKIIIDDARASALIITNEATAYTKQAKKDADLMVSDVRAFTAEKAIKPYSKLFLGTSETNRISSLAWLFFTIIFTLAAGVWAFASMHSIAPESEDKFVLIQLITSKVLFTGLLLSAILWCGKQYKVARHQFTVNKHKADALSSFEAFIEASNEPSTRDAVLLQTTQTIFTQETSGYLDGKSDNQFDQYVKLANSMKNVAPARVKAGD